MIRELPAAAVESGLEQARQELEETDALVQKLESRRDRLRVQPDHSGKADGLEAELAGLETKREQVRHRIHLLEGRQRELRGDQH